MKGEATIREILFEHSENLDKLGKFLQNWMLENLTFLQANITKVSDQMKDLKLQNEMNATKICEYKS